MEGFWWRHLECIAFVFCVPSPLVVVASPVFVSRDMVRNKVPAGF